MGTVWEGDWPAEDRERSLGPTRASLLAGHGILKTAKLCGVSNGPVKRIKAALVTT